MPERIRGVRPSSIRTLSASSTMAKCKPRRSSAEGFRSQPVLNSSLTSKRARAARAES